MIGVDIRTVTNTVVGRNLYPRFEVWVPTNDAGVYTRVMSIEIRLTPDNFTTNGQYRFTLPTPLNVSSGYRIGVYQPPGDRSVVRFHYINLPGDVDHDRTGKVQLNDINNNEIRISGGGRHVDYEEVTILIHPIVQNTSCFAQFVPDDIINSLSYSITDSYYVDDTRIFPDIRFTCHGIITNWIIGGSALVMPVIKIRHSNNLTTTAATLNTSASNAVMITSLLYNFTMSNEITVQPGDILMIESNTTNYMFYQQYNGPHNYRLGDNNELIALDTNDYPLISVVVATSTISSTHINTVNTVLPSSSIYSTATVTMESMKYTKTSLTTSMESTVSTPVTTSQDTGSNTTLVLTENTITVSASMNSTVINTPLTTSQNTRSNTLILAGSISTAVFILLVVTILVILIVSVLVCRRIWYKTSNGNDTFSSGERKADINQQSDAPNMENTLLASANPAYGVTGERHNTDVSANPAYGVAEKSGVSANPAYGINTGGIESINEESLVYDEPRTMYHEQEGKTTSPMGNLRNNRLSNYENPVVDVATRWIVIEDNIKFTCATVTTEILIGVDVRTVNDTVSRNLYPKFEVWAPTNDDDVYTRVMSVEIRLTPDNFTTNGQYHFSLPTPLNVSSGYRIGVYQPPDDRSVVRFHYVDLPGMDDEDRTGKVQTNLINNSDIRISGGGQQVDLEDVTILIHPIVQNTSCFPQFVPDKTINSLSYSITNSYYVSDTRIFPDIRFTCHGIITNWIVYAPAQVSVIKIRHSNNLTTTAATLNISASNAVMITSILYNFTMSNEITVQPGDILMIKSSSTNLMFYQQYNGPHNYRLGNNNELIALDNNDYPLISIVVEPFTNTATSTISSTHINTVITVLPSSSIYSTATVTMESMEYTETNSISSNSLSLTIVPNMENTLWASTNPAYGVTGE
uniref:Uncharacterized protein n=1 Tax=Amphimedon queenslandica TaxID=400682 RepID=A0A1X7TLP9_AMPQE